MHFFCPGCWEDIPASAARCPCCGATLAELDRETFGVKLRRALRHPEPQAAVRAAWILGERRERGAVADLIRALGSSPDPFLAEAAAEALGKIGETTALPALRRAREAGALRVRRAAAQAIQRLAGGHEQRR
jgi:HEAT repeat protein